MPSFDGLETLGPDACRSDRCAPCYYLHLKRRALNGGRDELSERELTFVGVGGPLNTPGGWRAATSLPLLTAASLDDKGSDTDAAILRAMQALGVSPERLDFLA